MPTPPLAALREVHVPRTALDALCFSPVVFDALIGENERSALFEKTLRADDPGVAAQRVTPRWPHHLPGELVIGLTGQAATILLRRLGVIDASWRGHGVRITDARYSAPVLVGERFLTHIDIARTRRLRDSLHLRLHYRMWKHDPAGAEIETYRSEQDAIFFPG